MVFQTVLFAASGELVDANDLILEYVQHRSDGQRESILVALRMAVGGTGIEKALHKLVGVAVRVAVRAVRPWIALDYAALGEVKLRYRVLNQRII